MSRVPKKALALAAAVVMLLPMAGAHAADAGTYEHVWSLQTLVSGSVGETRQRVLSSSAEMALEGGVYVGSVTYSDLLGVSTEEGVGSQESQISLALNGTPLEGGVAAGGTFTGTARIDMRDASGLDDAVSDDVRGREGRHVLYSVSGHWGARLDDGLAEGEIIYERAAVSEGDETLAEPAPYFNRASVSNPDALGDAQLFSALVEGIAPTDGGSSGGGDGAGEAGPGGADGDSAESRGPSFFEYVLKGLRGEELELAAPVPEQLATAGRLLYEANPGGATPLPAGSLAIDVHVAGSYLDAKNRAAGLLDDTGPSIAGAGDLGASVAAARAAVPGIPAVPTNEDAGLTWATRGIEALASQADVAGAAELAEELALVRPDAGRTRVLMLRVRALAIEAVGASESYGSVLRGAAAVASGVRDSKLAEGARSDAVLAAADDPRSPVSATDVRSFSREEGLDTSGTASFETTSSSLLPELAMAAAGGDPLAYVSSTGLVRLEPAVWLAYRRQDGAVYWLAEEDGTVALTDGSLRGWAFVTRRAAVVDAERAGRWVAVFALR
ncbi:MAG: hypothetical protein OEV43_06510 [Coriobacteriia bacterium]|nr:hypothetical protein [Coriobacteriia bacterium]